MTAPSVPAPRPIAFEDLRGVVAPSAAPRVSMYLPLQSFPAAARNQITARRAVREAEKRLEAFVMSEPQRRRFGDLLRAVESVVGTQAHPGGSLAALLDPAHLCIVPLAERCPARVGVGHCYALRPLLRAMARDSKYRALAVSAQQVTLFEGDGRGLAQAPAWEHPPGFDEERGAGSRSPRKGDLARLHHRIARAMARRFARRSLPWCWWRTCVIRPAFATSSDFRACCPKA